VIDRLLLYIFFGVTAGGTMGILFSAPNVFEYVNQTQVLSKNIYYIVKWNQINSLKGDWKSEAIRRGRDELLIDLNA